MRIYVILLALLHPICISAAPTSGAQRYVDGLRKKLELFSVINRLLAEKDYEALRCALAQFGTDEERHLRNELIIKADLLPAAIEVGNAHVIEKLFAHAPYPSEHSAHKARTQAQRIYAELSSCPSARPEILRDYQTIIQRITTYLNTPRVPELGRARLARRNAVAHLLVDQIPAAPLMRARDDSNLLPQPELGLLAVHQAAAPPES